LSHKKGLSGTYNREFAAPVFRLSEFDLPKAMVGSEGGLDAVKRK